MFTTGQQVTCVNSNNQPTLSEGATYTVREVGERGIRVNKEDGTAIRYELAFSRFEPMVEAQPAEQAAEQAAARIQFEEAEGVLVIGGGVFAVTVNTDFPGQDRLSIIKRLA